VPATRYGTVTTTGPLTVTLDGEDMALAASPINLGQALAVGDRVACEFRDKSLVILGSPVNGARDLWVRNFEALVHGGGVRTATSTGVSWSQRFIMTGAGRGKTAPAGYFNIDNPTDGTVIPVYGSASKTSATVASGVVPLGTWETLYYELPFGATVSTSDPSRFRIVYFGTDFEVPPTWVPVVIRSGDTGSAATYRWADGRESQAWTYPTLGNSWANYTLGYASARYKRENGVVTVQGLIKGGTPSSSSVAFTLPAGYRPDSTVQYASLSSGGVADIRVFVGGSVTVYSLISGTSASVSLSIPPFPAEV
jgi:hypothetical protein